MVRYNLFQRLVRQWEKLHPYNGVQVMQLRGRVDLPLAQKSWHDALESLGLGGVEIGRGGYRHYSLNGEAIHHTVKPCPPGMGLEAWITHELNRSFGDEETSVPFRPFVIEDKDTYWMGLSYQHWVADSTSIRLLMREWFVRQFEPALAMNQLARSARGGYLNLFGPHRLGWQAGAAMLASLRWQSQFKRARRIEDPEIFPDLTMRFKLLDLQAGLIAPLHARARELGVTVNDIFQAAIAEACDLAVPAPRRWHRQDLAIGTVVDLRHRTQQELADVFDLLLGFTGVSCRPEHFADWPTLLNAVATQSKSRKHDVVAEVSWMPILVGLVAGHLLSSDKIMTFYRKRFSLAGAISNVNLNRCWAGRYHGDPLLQYVRVAPTGPMTPLVVTATTLGSSLSMGLAYRPAILSEPAAASMCETVSKRLEFVTAEHPPRMRLTERTESPSTPLSRQA